MCIAIAASLQQVHSLDRSWAVLVLPEELATTGLYMRQGSQHSSPAPAPKTDNSLEKFHVDHKFTLFDQSTLGKHST